MVFDVVVEVPMDADEYLRVKDSAAYKAFHCEKNGTLNEYISDEVVDGERRTVTKTIPNIAIPWALRRAILGNRRVEFIDRRRWRDGAHLTAPFTQHFQTTNNISDRCVVNGTVTVERHGPNRCRIIARGECVVDVKGLGGKIEQLIVNNLRGSYEKVPAVVAEWLAISARRPSSLDEAPAAASEFTSLDLGPPTPPDDDDVPSTTADVEAGRANGVGSLPRQPSYAFDRDEERFQTPRNMGKHEYSHHSGAHEPTTSFLHPTPAPHARFTQTRGRSLLSSRKPGAGIRGRRGGRGFRRSTSPAVFFAAVAAFWVFAAWYYLFGSSSSLVTQGADDVGDAGLREAAIAREMAAGRLARDRAYGLHRERHEAAVGASVGAAAKVSGERYKSVTKADVAGAGTDEGARQIVGCVDARREECEGWACDGECESNPAFMLERCPCACEDARRRGDAAFDTEGGVKAFETDASRGVALGLDWLDVETGKRRGARVRVRLDPADAPEAAAAVRAAVAAGKCAPGVSGTCPERACHFHRAERAYGLVQGTLAGLEKAGGRFEDGRTEGAARWARGTVGYTPGGPNVLVATKDHEEWDASFTAFGRVVESDMAALDDLLDLPTTPFVHPEYKTTMAMLVTKVRFTLEGATDV